MFSAEDEGAQKVVKENCNEKMENQLKSDLEENFSKKCNISDESIESEPCVNAACSFQLDSENSIQTKKENQSTKSKVSNKFTHPCVPKINCVEKIIFCIDMSSEMEEISFRKNDGTQHTALSMVKRTIELFVHNKNHIDKKHEYSLMVLYHAATWVREFTNDPMELIDSLEDLNETQPCNSCDLGSIVQLICEKFDMVVPTNLMSVQYAIRVILVYGRSNCMFHFSNEQLKETLVNYPFLFLDILYIHEPPSEENKSKEIYDALCDLDEQHKSYIFEVTHNITKLHNCMAKFLAHPLQRVAQKNASYKIPDIELDEEKKDDSLCDEMLKMSLSV